ncbi:thiol-disulfide oxidoreductase DCC family protein [Arcobacteraceae bacterium]|nr:thiol-disulfide oxidoreductase DCC family protein [Arcobacteraceae bacterium]
MKHSIIIFDGVCNFCNKSVNFIIKRDPNTHFLFTPNQSAKTQEILEKYNLSDITLDTLVLIKDDKYYLKSEAVFEIIKDLSGFWYFFGIFRILPLSFRDYCYTFISKNRYNLFGKKDSCMMPSDNLKNRFI